MVGTPFVTFYLAGIIIGSNVLILVKLFLLVCLYIVLSYAGQLLYDDRLMSLLPLNIYLSTKLWMYFTWFIYILPSTTIIINIIFLLSSSILWYFFLKSWLGDAGVILANREMKLRVSLKYLNVEITSTFVFRLFWNLQKKAQAVSNQLLSAQRVW